jgi:hypothetical protein
MATPAATAIRLTRAIESLDERLARIEDKLNVVLGEPPAPPAEKVGVPPRKLAEAVIKSR